MENSESTYICKAVLYAVYLPAVVVLGCVLYTIARAVLDPLRHIPGPFQARFSRLWYLKHINQGRQETTEVELHKTYGPVVRLAPNQYSFSDIGATKVIYDHGSKFVKSDFYTPFGSPNKEQTNIFQERDPHAHAAKKRKIASLYSMSSIVSYEPWVDGLIETFCNKLNQFAKSHQAIDLPAWMQFYAFDVIGAISIGDPYGFMEHGSDFPGIIHELRIGQEFAIHLGTYAGSWYQTITTILSRLGIKPKFQATQSYAEASLAKKQLDIKNGKVLDETVGKQDFAGRLLSLKAQGKVTDYDLIASIRGNIAAGSDTTSISLSATMYYFLRNPSIFVKLRREVDEHKAKQTDPDKNITYADAQEMPYLQAIIKETLRLYPAIGMQLPRVVPKGGATISGHFFPAGTIVGINPWVIHRQTELFGEDANDFRPERWLENEQAAKEMDRYMFAFGAGSRTCLGRHISMLEMQKLIPELVRRYDLEFAHADGKLTSLNRFFIYTHYECRVKMRS